MKRLTDVKRRVRSAARWIGELQRGLDGHTASLGAGQADAMQKFLETIDIHLVSLSAASKQGLILRRGQKPILIRYYPAPISAHHALYCVEQFTPKDSLMVAHQGKASPAPPG